MAPGKSNSSPSRKLRSGNGNGSGRKSSSCCGPSMRLVIVCLSLAIVCVSIVAFLVVDVPRVHLNDYVLPSKHLHAQGLKNTGKLKWNKTCDGFGVRQDFFFPKYGGKACGQSFWEASTDLVDEEPPIQKAQLVYKIFTTNESAQEYFEKFWGRHLYDRLPPYLYTEVEKVISERVGDDRTAYFWHPKLVSAGVPVPLQAARVPLHVIFIFRQGPAFIRVTTDGFYGRRDEKKLIQAASTLSYNVARQVRRAGNKFTPFRQRFYDTQYKLQRRFYTGLARVRIFAESMWTQYMKRIRNRLRRLASFLTKHLSSYSSLLDILSQLLSEVFGNKLQFWIVAVGILLLQPIQCSVTLQLSEATQEQFFCKSCLAIHAGGRRTRVAVA